MTKRQKRILYGSGAGILGILLTIIIIYICSGGNKKQSDLVRSNALLDRVGCASDSRAVGAAGRSLQAMNYAPNTSSGSISQEETELNKENESQTAKVIKNSTFTETTKKQQDAEPAALVVKPLQTCEDYQGALAEALKTPNDMADLDALYVKVQELCEGPHKDLAQFVRQQFEARKAEIFASEKPI